MTHDPADLLAPGIDLAAVAHDHPLPVTHASVFRAPDDWAFNLHSYLHHDGEQFHAMWSSGEADEEGAGQVARHATSDDGLTWSASTILAPAPPRSDGKGVATCIARGMFDCNGALTALVSYIDELLPGYRWINLRLARFEWDGTRWVDRGIMLDDAINNFPPRRHAGRWIMSTRNAVREMFTACAGAGDASSWHVTPLPKTDADEQMSEPSWYVAVDGTLHMIFRDGRGSGWLYRSISEDDGVTWSAPVRTNYRDATSKNFTGRLSDGRYYLISNASRGRRSLIVTTSDDGWRFGNPKVLCIGDRPMRHTGRAKPTNSVQYPHAIEHDGALWVVYSTNKEDIDVLRVDVGNL